MKTGLTLNPGRGRGGYSIRTSSPTAGQFFLGWGVLDPGSFIELGKVLVPDPPNCLLRIILIPCKPQLSSLTNHIKNFACNIGQVRKTRFSPGPINVKLVDASHRK